MQLEILGSGTSFGVPVIGCNCKACTSADKYDKRYRASAWLTTDSGTSILIDCGPEFRLQALRAGIHNLSAVLITHAHADHSQGLDDLRIFSKEHAIPIYLNTPAYKSIEKRFDYVFHKPLIPGSIPQFNLFEVVGTEKIIIDDIEVTPIPLLHGGLETLGWRIGNTAYLTDCNCIPESSYRLLNGVENLIIDALRSRKHISHFSFSESLDEIEKIGAKNAWFTHICHDYTHTEIKAFIKAELEKRPKLKGKKIEPAFDGLLITGISKNSISF